MLLDFLIEMTNSDRAQPTIEIGQGQKSARSCNVHTNIWNEKSNNIIANLLAQFSDPFNMNIDGEIDIRIHRNGNVKWGNLIAKADNNSD